MTIEVNDISEQPRLIEVHHEDGSHRHNFNPSFLGYTTLVCQVGDCIASYHESQK